MIMLTQSRRRRRRRPASQLGEQHPMARDQDYQAAAAAIVCLCRMCNLAAAGCANNKTGRVSVAQLAL